MENIGMGALKAPQGYPNGLADILAPMKTEKKKKKTSKQ